MSYKKFTNTKCPFFPCHEVTDKENFNCMFCYCPLYVYDNCGGNFQMLDGGIKDCSCCVLPHYDYDYVVGFLSDVCNGKREQFEREQKDKK